MIHMLWKCSFLIFFLAIVATNNGCERSGNNGMNDVSLKFASLGLPSNANISKVSISVFDETSQRREEADLKHNLSTYRDLLDSFGSFSPEQCTASWIRSGNIIVYEGSTQWTICFFDDKTNQMPIQVLDPKGESKYYRTKIPLNVFVARVREIAFSERTNKRMGDSGTGKK